MATVATNSTPLRGLPGTYFQTPGPEAQHTRRRLFQDGPVTTRSGSMRDPTETQRARQPQALPAVDGTASMPPVLRAARAVNQALQQDESFPDLDLYCRPGASSEYDVQYVDSAYAPFQRTQIYAIPERILNRYNGSQLTTKMGLFAEINHAWACIDNGLFLWDYTHPNPEIIGFEDQPHGIQAVALVPPKPGVFVASITHILVITTTTDILLLGVAASTTPTGAKTISLYQTKMALHRGGSDVSIVAGSAGGRIFVGGDGDTDVHEIYYQQEEKWFSSRCGKINHTHPGWSSVLPALPPAVDFWSQRDAEHLVDMVVDDTRSLLYTLSNKSTIRTYHMEAPDRLTKVIEKEKNHCLRDIAHMINASPLLTDRMSIVSISPIPAQEASKLHLMALTSTGCRLFLSATSSASYMMIGGSSSSSSGPSGGSSSNSMAPQSMQVQFVKFPPRELPGQERRSAHPGGSLDGVDLQSRALETSRFGQRFAPGYFFDFVSKDATGGDLFFVSAPETGRIQATLSTSALKYFEHGSWIDIGSLSRALAVGQITRPFAAARQPLGFGNELAVQFDEAPSEFAVLTNDGVHVVRRRRLVDIFGAAIRNAAGEDSLERETRRFFTLYGRVETISAALAVACGQGNDLRTGTSRAPDQGAEDRAKAAFISHGGQPTVPETDGTNITTDSVKLSYRHDALVLYLTRLVRMLWKTRVVVASASSAPSAAAASGAAAALAGGFAIMPTVPTAKLTIVQENLERLRTFLRTNAASIQGLSGPPASLAAAAAAAPAAPSGSAAGGAGAGAGGGGGPSSSSASSDLQRRAVVGSRQDEIAVQAEHQALHALQKLMENISEGISFVLMLFDERVTDIYARLDETSRQQLLNLTYESLFSQPAGRDLAKLLVKAIVNRNIESGANVETVADALRRRCGSFCSPDDVVVFKAQEQLQRAAEQASAPNVARALLNESLRLFERVAGSLSHTNLRLAVEQYAELKYYAGAIQLCLVVAKEKDRGQTALAWINEGRADGDPRRRAWEERKRCYELIHAVMQQLDADSSREPDTVDGRLTLAATKRLEAYGVVNDSDDEVFHFDLYDWYIAQGWTDRIIAIESPHVVTFLTRLAARDAEHADLLCRFYTHRGRFFEAAQVQADLANSDFDISIKDRITLLSRAKANASVSTTGVGRQQQQQLTHEVTELLEIAHIQDDLFERLQADPRIPDERKAEIRSALDGKIRNLTELYNSYADPAGYYDVCLLIYHAADYHNPRVITDSWNNLIESTHQEIEERRAAYQDHLAGRQLPPGVAADAPPPEPYEAISMQVQSIAHRTSLDSLIFPVDTLLPSLCQYAFMHQQDASIGADPAWPVLLFLQLDVPHAMIVRVLERVLDAQEAPFTGRRRKVLVDWINKAVEEWLREVERKGLGTGKGEAGLAPWVVDLMERAEQVLGEIIGESGNARVKAEVEATLRITRQQRTTLNNIVRLSSAQGSLRFR